MTKTPKTPLTRILFLDDSPRRAAKFQERYPFAVWVATAAGAIEQLQAAPWQIVCLDHDLAGETMVDSSRADCGFEVVRWVARARPLVGRFIVHTWNEKAGRAMVAALLRAGYSVLYAPFESDLWTAPAPEGQ